MPQSQAPEKTLEEIAAETHYSVEAFLFVQEGLTLTACNPDTTQGDHTRHVTGQELAEGLKDLAIKNWGFMARIVLERWGVVSTMDFGRIVYALIDVGMMSKTAQDSLEDFRQVYDFKKAFDSGYRIQPQVATQ